MNKIMCEQVFRDLKLIFLKGVAAVQPTNLIKKHLNFDPASQILKVATKEYNLKNKNVYLFGAGKAVRNMSLEVESVLKNKICDGIMSVPYGSVQCESTYVRYLEGARNNLPDSAAEQTTKLILQSLDKLNENDFVLFLISGGGSALLPLPTDPITLTEKTDLIKSLANSGAEIKQLNIVRKKISSVKGGKLVRRCFPAQMVCLILSDIVGDPIELIASGPTVADCDDSNSNAARDILEKYNLMDKLPSSVVQVINSPAFSERFPEEIIDNYIIGSNRIAISAAVEQATELNYISFYMSNHITGDVHHVATCYIQLCAIICRYLSHIIEGDTATHLVNQLDIPHLNFDINKIEGSRDVCLVFGGETTVKLTGEGKGGRNQQMALTFGSLLHKYSDIFSDYDVYLLSAGTDGIDGPTDAAGAISYKELVADAKKQNLDVNCYLENNDSYNFFKCFQDGRCHVFTGHTNTNVMDLQIIVIRKK